MTMRKAAAVFMAAIPTIVLLSGCIPQGRSPERLILPGTSLLKMEMDGPEQVKKGERYKWTITLTNTGPYHLGLIKLIHVETEMLQFDEPWSMSEEDLKVWTYRVKHMAPGEAKLVTVEGTAIATGEMELHTGVTYIPYGTIETRIVD